MLRIYVYGRAGARTATFISCCATSLTFFIIEGGHWHIAHNWYGFHESAGATHNPRVAVRTACPGSVGSAACCIWIGWFRNILHPPLCQRAPQRQASERVGAPLVAVGFVHYIYVSNRVGLRAATYMMRCAARETLWHHSVQNAQAARGGRLTNSGSNFNLQVGVMRSRCITFTRDPSWHCWGASCRL